MSKKFTQWNEVKTNIFEVLPQEDLRASPEGNCESIVPNTNQKVNKAVGDE